MADNSVAVRDPYLWQNDPVLKNRLDIHDEAQLRKAELAFSAARLATLDLGPRTLGMPWLRHIHFTLFQDIYSWAGELRTIDMWHKEMPCCHCEYIETQGNALMDELENEHWLSELSQDTFVARLAYYVVEMHVLHPFRAGNGRAQRIFFEQLALHAGYLLEWSALERDDWNRALNAALDSDGNMDGLHEQLAKGVSPAR